MTIRRGLDHPELHPAVFAISIEYQGVLLVAAPIVKLEKSAALFADLAHRNWTNASCDAQIRRTISTAFCPSPQSRWFLAKAEQKFLYWCLFARPSGTCRWHRQSVPCRWL
jgi:hypothetical protein